VLQQPEYLIILAEDSDRHCLERERERVYFPIHDMYSTA